jgi:gas vesicle protein
MSTGKVFLGVLAGATAGALAGVLFAPHRGKVTRKKIYRSGGVLAEEVKEKFDEFIDSVTVKISKAKDNVTDFAEQRMAKSDEAKKQAKTT